MFCTSKERETCNVEKMTCEGCYYNKDGDYMNEEETINRIKYRINELRLNYAIDNLDLEAIQGLLNLYNQEKEKNKKLEEERQHLMDSYLKQAEIKMKIIDMMAEDISHTETFPWENIDSEKVKEYYFKKARGEENGNKD